jgi:peptide/nickel transport system permease protein
LRWPGLNPAIAPSCLWTPLWIVPDDRLSPSAPPVPVAQPVAASLVIFLVMEVVPGDPASFMMGINADPQAVAALRTQLGLDQPLPLRYLGWVAGLLQGDFGISYTYRVPVSELIAERVVISLPLTLYALALSTLIAFPGWNSCRIPPQLGRRPVGDGRHPARRRDPQFLVRDDLMVLVFAVNLRWFSAGGFPGWEAGFWPAMKALTLPAIALACRRRRSWPGSCVPR